LREAKWQVTVWGPQTNSFYLCLYWVFQLLHLSSSNYFPLQG
jgi:hypothetical protein